MVVTLHLSASGPWIDNGFTDRRPGHHPQVIGGNHGNSAKRPPRRTYRPSRLCGTGIPKMARRVGAAPTPSGFGDPTAQLTRPPYECALHMENVRMVRSAGVAPASPRWQRDILLLNHERAIRGGSRIAPPTPHVVTGRRQRQNTNKERTPSPRTQSAWPRVFSVDRFGVIGHTFQEALLSLKWICAWVA